MPGIYPPSKETIQSWKDMTKYAKRFVIYIDDALYIDSMTSFLIWDDVNEVLHCIDANTACTTEYTCPFRMRHVGYNQFEEFCYEL